MIKFTVKLATCAASAVLMLTMNGLTAGATGSSTLPAAGVGLDFNEGSLLAKTNTGKQIVEPVVIEKTEQVESIHLKCS